MHVGFSNVLSSQQYYSQNEGSPPPEQVDLGAASAANTSIHAAAQMAKESAIPRMLAMSEKEKKMQFVQYESEKSKLKEEYEKRVGFLHKRMNKRATMDPSFLLLNSMTNAQPMTTRNDMGRQVSSDPFF